MGLFLTRGGSEFSIAVFMEKIKGGVELFHMRRNGFSIAVLREKNTTIFGSTSKNIYIFSFAQQNYINVVVCVSVCLSF